MLLHYFVFISEFVHNISIWNPIFIIQGETAPVGQATDRAKRVLCGDLHLDQSYSEGRWRLHVFGGDTGSW